MRINENGVFSKLVGNQRDGSSSVRTSRIRKKQCEDVVVVKGLLASVFASVRVLIHPIILGRPLIRS